MGKNNRHCRLVHNKLTTQRESPEQHRRFGVPTEVTSFPCRSGRVARPQAYRSLPTNKNAQSRPSSLSNPFSQIGKADRLSPRVARAVDCKIGRCEGGVT